MLRVSSPHGQPAETTVESSRHMFTEGWHERGVVPMTTLYKTAGMIQRNSCILLLQGGKKYDHNSSSDDKQEVHILFCCQTRLAC